jgi:large subunit ribosomal protein L10
MPLSRQGKVELGDQYKGMVENTAGLLVFTYHGLSVAKISALRTKVREAGGQMQVVKNRMLKRAVEGKDYSDQLKEYLVGPNAVIFANEEDPISPAKALVDFAKTNEAIEIKAGVVGSDFIDAKGVVELSKVPSKEELYAKILGGIKAPASGILGGVKGLHQKLHGLFTAYTEKLEKEAA